MSKFMSWLGCLLYFRRRGLPFSQLQCFLVVSTEGLRAFAEVSSNILNGVQFKDCSFFSDSETPIMINLLSSVSDSNFPLTFILHSCVLSNFLNSAYNFYLNLSVYFSLYWTVLESRLMRSLRESSSQTFSFTICLRILSQRVKRQPQRFSFILFLKLLTEKILNLYKSSSFNLSSFQCIFMATLKQFNLARSVIFIKMQEDQLKVEDTNQQALASKISAIKKGYFVDNFAEEFTQYRGKRDIIIHRGYWARVFIVRRLIETMIQHGQNVQIVSLGCGLETVWFNLMEEGHIKKPFKFVELDLESVVKKKIRKINHSKKLAKLFEKIQLKPVVSEHQHLLKVGDAYTLTVCDLSNISEFEKILEEHKIDTTIPTFFYSECVLSYIDADRVDDLVAYLNKKFNLAFLFDYEMYNPHDRFGQLMVKNFDLRGCPLIGIHKYPELKDQQQRYIKAGFKTTEVFTMLQIYNDCIDRAERLKIQKIEMLDELQEWNLIMAHYFGLLSTTYNEQGQKHPNFQELTKNMRLKH